MTTYLKSSLSIGSDVELGIVYDDLKTQKMAREIYDSNPIGWGVDGHSDIAELRTDSQSCESPEKHIDALLKYLENPPEELRTPKHVIVSGSCVLPGIDPLGGHLHFNGTPALATNLKNIIRALDYFVALPILVYENPTEATYRRLKTSYGKLSSYREKSSNINSYHFEYRTLPSFFVTKGMLKAVYKIAYTVVSAYHDQPTTNLSLPPRRWWVKKFYFGQRDKLRRFIPTIHTKLRTLPLYPKYRDDIESFFGLAPVVKPWKCPQPSFVTKYLTGDKVTKQVSTVRWNGNYSDYHISDILQELINGKVPLVNVFIFGIKDAHGITLSYQTNFEDQVSLPSYTPFLKRKIISGRTFTEPTISIGLSRSLRRAHNANTIANYVRDSVDQICALPEIQKLLASLKTKPT